MKNLDVYFPIVFALGMASCGNKTESLAEGTPTPKTLVEVVTVSNGSINDELTLFGTTVYLKRNLVTASLPSFITQVNVKLGDKVSKGDVLYVLQSKESRALGNDVSKIDTSLNNLGVIKVKASASGIITTLDKQQPGDYVLEGTQLCTIAESNDLAFQVNVPFEYTPYTKIGTACTLILPDSTEYSAVFTKALTAMNVNAQTQTILAKCNENIFLPENMIVKVEVRKGTGAKKQLLPKSCVLSDEMMKDFWVMEVLNDSTAIRIPVTVGNKNAEKIEVLSPTFNVSDKIISIGNYGLSDTAAIIIKRK